MIWRYLFPSFELEYHPDTGYVQTTYPDTTWSGGFPVPDDQFHADLLGITASDHRRLHELGHHLIGRAFGHPTCPIVRASALHMEMPEGADLLEWKITALCYFAFEKPFRHDHEWNAMKQIAQVCNPHELADNLRSLFYGNSIESVKVEKTT